MYTPNTHAPIDNSNTNIFNILKDKGCKIKFYFDNIILGLLRGSIGTAGPFSNTNMKPSYIRSVLLMHGNSSISF